MGYTLTIILKEQIPCTSFKKWRNRISILPFLFAAGEKKILLTCAKNPVIKQVIENATIDRNRHPIANSVVPTWGNKINNLAWSQTMYQESGSYDDDLMPNCDRRKIEYLDGERCRRLKELKLSVETNTGKPIEFNLYRQTLKKNRWLDAGHIVKFSPVKLKITGIKPWLTERTAIAMLPRSRPQQFCHLGRPQNQTASPMPTTAKLRTAMVDLSMGEEK